MTIELNRLRTMQATVVSISKQIAGEVHSATDTLGVSLPKGQANNRFRIAAHSEEAASTKATHLPRSIDSLLGGGSFDKTADTATKESETTFHQ